MISREIHGLVEWSGRRGSNPRPPAWKASALSTELLPHCVLSDLVFVGTDGFEPPKAKASRFTVCPIWPLWNMPITLVESDPYRIQTYNLLIRSQVLYSVELTDLFRNEKWALTDSNRRPSACKADALNQLS